MPQTKVRTMESRKNDQEVERDEKDPYRGHFGEGDLTPSWSIGPTRSFLC
jgi:hypothetical protein